MTTTPPEISTGFTETDKAFSMIRDYVHFCVDKKSMLNSEANAYLAVLRIMPVYVLPLEESERPELQQQLKVVWKQIQMFAAKVLIELDIPEAANQPIILKR